MKAIKLRTTVVLHPDDARRVRVPELVQHLSMHTRLWLQNRGVTESGSRVMIDQDEQTETAR